MTNDLNPRTTENVYTLKKTYQAVCFKENNVWHAQAKGREGHGGTKAAAKYSLTLALRAWEDQGNKKGYSGGTGTGR